MDQIEPNFFNKNNYRKSFIIGKPLTIKTSSVIFIVLAILSLFFYYYCITYKTFDFKELNVLTRKESIICIQHNTSNISNQTATSNNTNKIVSKIFKLHNNDLSPRELWMVNKNVSMPPYQDLHFLKTCKVPYWRKELFDILKFWIKFCATHDIPFWMIYGTLIGTVRHHDLIPWDTDMDLGVPTQFESVIRNLSTPRANISFGKINIVVRPGPHCPYNGLRQDCKGKSVNSHVDGCAFCGPLARIFYHHKTRIDIYLYEFHFHKNGKMEVGDEGIFEYSNKMPHIPMEWLLPLRNCSMMGLTVQCPRQTERFLISYYKDFTSRYECVGKSWKKKKIQ